MATAPTPEPVEPRRPPATAAVTVIVSDEELLVARALEEIARGLTAADPEVEVAHLQAADVTPADVVDLRSPSLFGGLRLVVVHDVAALPEPILTALTDYARHPLAEVFLAVVAAPTTPRKLLDALAKGCLLYTSDAADE